MRPRAINVKPLNDYKLLITFNNNETKIFDVKPYLKYKQYNKLKNISIFNTVKIGGLSVEWIDGTDICPDELYNQSKSVN